MPWTMFVEGSSDEAFLSGVLSHLDISNVETERINGGVGKLGSVARQMQRRSLRGNRISVILDADADFEKRRGEYETERVRHELPIDRFFLLPNHRDTGCLETLLERIAVSGHRLTRRACPRRPALGLTRTAGVSRWRGGIGGGIEAGEERGGGVAPHQPVTDLGQPFRIGDRCQQVGQAGSGVGIEARRRQPTQQCPLLVDTLGKALFTTFRNTMSGDANRRL